MWLSRVRVYIAQSATIHGDLPVGVAREVHRTTPQVTIGSRGTAGDASHQGESEQLPRAGQEVGFPGLQMVAPSSGLHGACEVCGAPGVGLLELGRRMCEVCVNAEKVEKPSRARMPWTLAVTSAREIALSDEHMRTLKWTGAVMLGTSLLLLALLVAAWRGFDFSLVSTLSPWIGIYLPVPLGLLNGVWCLHCAWRGRVRHEGTGSCVSRAGLCGTAWGCSGPSCALNLGLDLGLLITALLATLPAGSSAAGCGYECYVILCFPCAPHGSQGAAACMVLAALGLALGVGAKMWVMTSALREDPLGSVDFLPW